MNSFITNSDKKSLKERLVELISKSEELKFLVGFFYFSGTQELYKTLKENPSVKLKILVGLNVDLLNYKLVEYDVKTDDFEARQLFLESLKKSLTNKIADTQEFYDQINFFIELIKQDRLIIKKTQNPNHSKLYIFKLDKTQVKKDFFITGSSNLTKPGLQTQEEFNVEISDYGTKEANDYFDKLWEDATPITEFQNFKQIILDVLQQDTLIKQLTPYEAFVLIIKTYLDSFKQKKLSEDVLRILADNGYKQYKYQMDAVKQAVSIIEQNNGVIVADVVGLGKTIIACLIAKQLAKRGVVICPPGLIGDDINKTGWTKYLEEFKLHDWKALSRGNLEDSLKYVKERKDIEIVIIDEAHYFRNQDTQNYELIKNICRGKKVILLTATPFNNHPNDIFSLLKLFIIPKQSTMTLTNNLSEQFLEFSRIFDKLSYIKKYYKTKERNKKKELLKFYKQIFDEEIVTIEQKHLRKVSNKAKELSRKIRAIIEPVVIRRNRIDLKENPLYSKEIQALSKVADPTEWFYELTNEQSKFYDEILEKHFADRDIGTFKGAIYRPFEYLVGLNADPNDFNEEQNRQYLQQKNFFGFMRRLLVKRFESSFGAFQQSLENFKKATENCLEFIERENKIILDRNLIDKILEEDDPNEIKRMLEEFSKPNSTNPKNNRVYKVNEFNDKEKFIEHIKSDISLFESLLQEMASLKLVENDPKSNCIIEKLKQQIEKEPKRKIIIFSEYLDTVDYLKEKIEKEFSENLLTISRNFNSKENEIYENFDASYKEQKNKYNILLCSDKLSEGFNLNRAGMIINYDIPWNPVRVIQRLGRINRINKKCFEELYIVNFFPTEKGANVVKSRDIAQNKMFLIHNALGEDSKIFSIDEEPQKSALYSKIQANPQSNDPESFYTSVLKEYLEIEQQYPEIIDKIKNCPPRVKVAKSYSNKELIVFAKKERLYVLKSPLTANKKDIEEVYFEEIYDNIKCEKDTISLKWNTEEFWATYNLMKDYKRDKKYTPKNRLSIETNAFNNLKSLINNKNLSEYLDFFKILLEDIMYYGTLPEYTLRKIANFKDKNIAEIKKLQEELGLDYLQKEIQNITKINKEIVIAVENIK
ncbi:helicase-related protein [Candidatus Ruminimicrobiellum ovillum]|uniref:helicase-related protein n=1 Tax=Candidatus Ruminimicrobiellum ovillum TaxID=1947927 RepID=UPI00355A4644